MDMTILNAAGEAMLALADPFRLLMLFSGVLLGLFLGIIPGIGGLVGMALLLPFTYTMDSYAAFAMLLGMVAVTGTSDTLPAVLFGVPGTSGAQATVLDGNAMAKKGEAGRALSAAFTASLLGGLVGALLLALSIPILRPLILSIGTPGLLGFTVFGVAMVAVLSGSAPLRGLTIAGFGVLLSMIGSDPQTGTLRYTMNSIYLWDGLPIVPLALGLFAVPELADLAIRRAAITSEMKYDVHAGTKLGILDAIRHWKIVIQGGGIGAAVGAIPGLGSSVVDWIAYGWISQTRRGDNSTFGKGDVRGVIAPESANNALAAGALVPTIAFGVPGSATMAVLLSVFLIHGLVPGPEMLTTELSVTYAMVWSIAIANILGAGICLLFSGYLAKIAVLRYTLILPAVMVFVFIGAYQSSRSWGDLYALIFFALLGWTMKQMRWPRPPLILGFVLGGLIERYIFISNARYGTDWLFQPLVLILFSAATLLLVGPFIKHLRKLGGVRGISTTLGMPRFHLTDIFYVCMLSVVGLMLIEAVDWPKGAKSGPLIVGGITFLFCALSLLNLVFSRSVTTARAAQGETRKEVHLDNSADYGFTGLSTILSRAAIFFGFIGLFLGSVALIGMLPTIPFFVVAYMWFERREKWSLMVIYAVILTLVAFLLFDQLLHVPWPASWVGQWLPVLKAIPSI